MSNTVSSREVHRRAVESLFAAFEDMCEGALSVDETARIVWISDKYRKLLGIGSDEVIIGREVEEIIPESLLRRVVDTGEPTLLDIMHFRGQYLVVSRLPIHDDRGRVVGAVGFALYDGLNYLNAFISKFENLQNQLNAAKQELKYTRQLRYSLANIIGTSQAMMEVRRQVRRVAKSASPVLITGETGTGKELLAQSIHGLSPVANGPFIAVNMGAIPESLLEAEFFGTAPGAFTGADRRGRKGKFELANGGTLFLDEIADMPVSLQVKLLRALEEGTIEPVGSNDLKKVQVRIVAATSQDIETKLQKGEFRKDFFYRLNVLQIDVPPLRDRLSDLSLLAEHLLAQSSVANEGLPKEFDHSAIALMAEYTWPGNVRELRNVIERACVGSDAELIDAAALVKYLPQNYKLEAPSATLQTDADQTLPKRIANFEREAIMQALQTTAGKKAPAARLLGISRSTLYEKLKEYNLS